MTKITRPRAWLAIVALAVLALSLAACSSEDANKNAAATNRNPECIRPAATPHSARGASSQG